MYIMNTFSKSTLINLLIKYLSNVVKYESFIIAYIIQLIIQYIIVKMTNNMNDLYK